MTKLSRNAPCPCGSGKKYKQCCLRKDQDERIALNKRIEAKKNSDKSKNINDSYGNVILVEDELDLLSNSTVDLINAGEFIKAEKQCRELLNSYPNVVDGLDRFAMLYEASGEKEKAAEYYKKSADYMKEKSGYAQESIEYALNKVEQLSY